ncbi:MAG: hypothetical protein GXO50_02080 [Chlorobi bacterium]|nr:hypothetical protein [Chlorobiota bacterium]
MKNTVKLSIFTLILFLQFSCSESKLDGDWDDNIGLSQKEIELSSENSSALVTTSGDSWWISCIVFNGNVIDFGDVNTLQDNFVIENADFKIERKNATEIYVEMPENNTDSVSVLNIYLEAGDYFTGIIVRRLPDL